MRIFTIKINSAILVFIKASKAMSIERLIYSVNLGYILLKIRVKAITTN
jgi:predicted transcriptional regulator